MVPIRRPPRSVVNFWVDLATAVAIAGMLGTGILLRWVLPPGTRGGRGISWLGEGRHFWGDVHAWISVLVLVLLGLHIVLHWSWITDCWRRFAGSFKAPATWAILACLATLIVLPVVIPTQRIGVGGGHSQRHSAAPVPRSCRGFSEGRVGRSGPWDCPRDGVPRR